MLTTQQRKPWFPLGLLILLGFIWGTGYSIARFATTNGVPPLGYSFWQAVGPALLLSLFLKSKRQTQQFSVPLCRYYLICGLTGIVIPNTTMYFAAPHLPAGILAVVVNTVPIITYPIALLSRMESFNWLRLGGVFCAMLGLMLILLPQTSLPSPDMIPWVLSVLITPLSFAICAIYIARWQPSQERNPLALSRGMLIFASLLLFPLVSLSGSFYALHWPLSTPDWIILLEILLSSVGYVLFFKLIHIAGPLYYSLVDTIVALTGLLWGWLLFHEKLNAWSSAAVLLILFALFLVTKQQQFVLKFARLAVTPK
ncbi:MAG: hypothetical protein A3J38_07205 [Gammaproteobacteria bacterium RIFCSPHIGHO2_12_FULL_45_9]|nr:MAG: hypothetical protein A3J38_07205 [Gammaproteobacteria bacterium RIFCSPHIGHO2_12_FULL_45_9]